jgi:hypothetical protein
MGDGSEAGFTIEEVIGPDGRYVLYYRWPDGDRSASAAEDDAEVADGVVGPLERQQPDV